MLASTKLTMLVLGLPISVMGILEAIVFYARGTLIIEISNLLSSIVVLLLVWERLRDSLSKKLDYLDDNIFLDLLYQLQRGELLSPQDEIRRRDDLKRHSRFMTIPLFPPKLLNKLDDFLLLHETFYEEFSKILDTVEKKVGEPNRWIMGNYLDLGRYASQVSPTEEKAYTEVVESMREKGLVDKTKNLFENAKTKRSQISQELEDFLKCNNLKLDKFTGFPN